MVLAPKRPVNALALNQRQERFQVVLRQVGFPICPHLAEGCRAKLAAQGEVELLKFVRFLLDRCVVIGVSSPSEEEHVQPFVQEERQCVCVFHDLHLERCTGVCYETAEL